MDRDGRNKRDLTEDSKEFAYGFSASPDGRRIAYHKNYQVYLADADGSNAREVETGAPLQLRAPVVARRRASAVPLRRALQLPPARRPADGTGLRKLADRGGYRGVVEFLDVPDFHGGSSDIPVWSADGQSIFYTAKVGASVELFRVALDGRSERLTRTPDGTLHYHPQPSPDGRWLAYGSKRDGVRNSTSCGSRTGPRAASPTSGAVMRPCGPTGNRDRAGGPATDPIRRPEGVA